MQEKPYSVYLLSCADGTLYCGSAKNAEKRLEAHQSGKGAKYTRSRLPVTLCYVEPCESRSEALKREYEIKQLSRAQKLALIKGEGCESDLFSPQAFNKEE